MNLAKYRKLMWRVIKFLFELQVVLVAYMYVSINFQVVRVQGSSMEPNYHNSDILLINSRYQTYSKDDVVVFKYENNGQEEEHIKRVYGVPGDKVAIIGNEVYINDEVVQIDELNDLDDQSYTLDEDEYFVLGDNKDVSFDSRIHGPISSHQIIGEVFVKLPIHINEKEEKDE